MVLLLIALFNARIYQNLGDADAIMGLRREGDHALYVGNSRVEDEDEASMGIIGTGERGRQNAENYVTVVPPSLEILSPQDGEILDSTTVVSLTT